MDNLIIDFDGTIVYTPSFLEETFGGAIRKGYVQVEKLTFINLPDEQRNDIYKYIKDALERRNDGN
ncbi:MAG: STAS-like domain-containing protein [Treponemataceae bacterium]|nr:STAS-like domain-containing protein [Treponemataceae bacterium]